MIHMSKTHPAPRRFLSTTLVLLLAVFAFNRASGQTFSNATPIIIPATGTSGPAAPYPSNINVFGLTGNVTSLTVSLFSLNHTFPDDIDILLVGPTGVSLLLMSDTGGALDLAGVNLTFMDGAPFLPDGLQIVSGTFAPTNFGTGDTFPAPAPAGPYGSMLANFNGTNGNGIWSLFVLDDLGGDIGNINGGYALNFNGAVTVPETGSTLLLLGLTVGGIVAARRKILLT